MKLHKKVIGGIAVSVLLLAGAWLTREHPATALHDKPKVQPQEQPKQNVNRVFTDIEDCYAQTEIIDLHDRGIINGVGDKLFSPHTSITRAEYITMLARSLGIAPVPSEIPAFRDVAKGSWAYGWVQAGVELGIANGTQPGAFSPDQSITREEAAILLVRALKIQTQSNAGGAGLPFADAASISDWALPHVAEAHRSGLMHGYEGNFRPHDPITRQETAVVLYRIIQNDRWGLKQPKVPTPKIHLGWQYDIPTSQFEQRAANSGVLNTLSPRWFFLDAAGKFTDKADTALLHSARANGQKVWPLLGNKFNRQATHRLVSQPAARKAAVAQLTEFVNKYQLGGLNLDFENLDPQDRDAYSAFVGELAAALHANHAALSVAVPMDVGTDWSDPFDYAALGRAADYIVIMAYDEHWTGSPRAGSVASPAWVDRGVDRILTDVAPNKTIVGLPLYTRDWFVQNGTVLSEDVTLPQQSQLLSKYGAQYSWDAAAGQYVAAYSSQGVRHSVWVEDSRSLAMKYQVVQRKGVAGFAFWYVGAETPDVWRSMQNLIKYETVGQQ